MSSQTPETIFCKCFICKGENPELGGKFVSIATFRRHRKKESNWNNSINIQNILPPSDYLECFSSTDSHLNLNIKECENFHDFQNDLIMDELQYNNDNLNDEESQNNDLSDKETQNNNSSDEDELQDYYMQEIQEYNNYDTQESFLDDLYGSSSTASLFLNNDETKLNISEDLIRALRLFEIKIRCNLTDNAFNQIMKAVSSTPVSIHCIKTTLKKLVNIEPQWIDMCINSCCAYTGQFESEIKCPYCNASRYQEIDHNHQKKSRYQFACFSLKERLRIQYKDPNGADELRYRYKYTSRSGFGKDGKIGDIFDGRCYLDLLRMGYFQDERDIALTGSIDGYQIFRQKTDDCWVVLFINANLPPEKRVLKENLLITSIIPGPKEPKDFNSFMSPIVDEFKELTHGIDCIDGKTKNPFTLKAHILSWSGDTPGLTKLMGLTGHNSYKGCRYCNIKGLYLNHVYYPTTPPIGSDSVSYDADNLPLRSHNEYKENVQDLEYATTKKEVTALQKDYGIKHRSILFDLHSIKFPYSFALDIMHLMFENVAIYMFKHWIGIFFNKDSGENNGLYILNTTIWNEIGNLMHMARKTFPSYLGRPPRNIILHYTGYKAEEWAAWITMYSLPLLKDRLPTIYYEGWALFVRAVKLCKKLHLSNENISEIQALLLAFYKHYEREYYRGTKERISAMKLCLHYLLHVADSIRNTGPCWATWQFPMERVCGMLLPLAKSRLHPYKNIINTVHLLELFNYLPYHQEIYQQIFPSQSPSKQYAKHLVYSNEDYLEEFYFPTKNHALSQSQLRKIKENLSTSYDVAGRNFDSFSKTGIMYGRMLTKDKYFIGSKWIQRNNDWARINYTVRVRMEVDKWAKFKNRQPEFITRAFYGNIEFYLLYDFDGQKEMLAYIHWTKPATKDHLGVLSFNGFSYYDFIRVSAIDRCVGFFQLGSKYYIIDKDAVEINE